MNTKNNKSTMRSARNFTVQTILVNTEKGHNGKFVSSNKSLVRDNKGRFSSTRRNVVVLRDAKGRFISNNAQVAEVYNLNVNNSSFLKSVKVVDDVVEVVMLHDPKIVYAYCVSPNVLKTLLNVSNTGKSVGEFYNKHLRGREYYRKIYS